jgi:hypothetical protein
MTHKSFFTSVKKLPPYCLPEFAVEDLYEKLRVGKDEDMKLYPKLKETAILESCLVVQKPCFIYEVALSVF